MPTYFKLIPYQRFSLLTGGLSPGWSTSSTPCSSPDHASCSSRWPGHSASSPLSVPHPASTPEKQCPRLSFVCFQVMTLNSFIQCMMPTSLISFINNWYFLRFRDISGSSSSVHSVHNQAKMRRSNSHVESIVWRRKDPSLTFLMVQYRVKIKKISIIHIWSSNKFYNNLLIIMHVVYIPYIYSCSSWISYYNISGKL